MSRFEGSFTGDDGRIDPGAVLECGVCWWVYDPGLGDAVWQVAPGTAFAELPEHWHCPNCDAAPHQFMVVDGRGAFAAGSRQRPGRLAGAEEIERRVTALETAYRRVADRMRSLPVCNPALEVRAVDFRPCERGLVGVVVTPWCMNLVRLPADGEARRVEGSTRDLAFPSGRYPFIAGYLDGVGSLETCSLFSPMDAFDDPAVARAVAEHALAGLFAAPEAQPARTRAGTLDQPMSRRRFLRGGRAAGEERPEAL